MPLEGLWWTDYYRPMEKKLAELRLKYQGNSKAQKLFDTFDKDLEMYRKYSAWYGYGFYIMRRTH